MANVLFFGWILVTFGVLLLLEAVGLVHELPWEIIGPLLLIVWGGAIVLSRGKIGCCCGQGPSRRESRDQNQIRSTAAAE